MPRIADDILVGGGRVFANNQEIGWLQGDFSLQESGTELTIKESEGATVLVLNQDKEVQFSFNLLEANLDTLRMLNPSYTQVVSGEENKAVEGEYIADLGKSNGLKNIPVVENVAIHVFPATTMTSANAVGDTTITVENPRRFEAGDSISIVRGTHVETFDVVSVDQDAGTIELDSDLMTAFPSGSMVKITTTSPVSKELQLGTDYNFYPMLGLITRTANSTNVQAGDGAAVDYTYKSYKGRGYGMGSFEDDTTYKLEFWHKKRSGKYRCIRMFKARISGDFTAFAITQDSESPLPITVTLMADETIADARRNIYEQLDYDAEAAPGGGW